MVWETVVTPELLNVDDLSREAVWEKGIANSDGWVNMVWNLGNVPLVVNKLWEANIFISNRDCTVCGGQY